MHMKHVHARRLADPIVGTARIRHIRKRAADASIAQGQQGELVHSSRFWRTEERALGKPLEQFAPDATDDEDTDMSFFVHIGGATPADQQKMEARKEQWTDWNWPMPREMEVAKWWSPGGGGSWLGAYAESSFCGPPVAAATMTQAFGMIEEQLDKDVARWAACGIAMEYYISAGTRWDKK